LRNQQKHPLIISSDQNIIDKEAKDAKIIPGQNPVQPKTAEGRQAEKKSKTTSIKIFYHQHGRTRRNGRLNSKPGKTPWDIKKPVLGQGRPPEEESRSEINLRPIDRSTRKPLGIGISVWLWYNREPVSERGRPPEKKSRLAVGRQLVNTSS
jgi:hypothetical protein